MRIYGTITNLEPIKNFNDYPKIKVDANAGDFIYIKGKIMHVDIPNSNGDMFPKEEVIREIEVDGKKMKAWETFIGGICDIEHDASTIIGRVIDATYIESKDKNETDWVEVICKLNRTATKNSKIDYVSQIEAGILNQMSLEAYAEEATCSICEHTFNFTSILPCLHIKDSLGRKIKCDDGEERMVFKKDKLLTFTGLGFVGAPADKRADIYTVVAKENESNKVKAFETEGMNEKLDQLKTSVIDTLKSEFKWKEEYIHTYDEEIRAWTSSSAIEAIETQDDLCREIAKGINGQIGKEMERREADRKEQEESDKKWEEENKKGVESNDKLGLNDALKKLNAVDFLNILRAIENKNSGKTQGIAMDIMAKAEILTEKEFYEILSKDYQKLSTIEIEDIKNILRSNKRLLGNEYNAYLFTDNNEPYWVVEKYGHPEFKKKVSELYGEDWNKADIKVDGVALREYAVSGAFKKRLLHTLQVEGMDHVKSVWEIEDNKVPTVAKEIIDTLGTIKARAIELGIKLTAEEIAVAMFNGSAIEASETLYIKDKFCKCVKDNEGNENLLLKGKQTKTEAAESFCYNKLVASKIVAGKQETDLNKIIWKIVGGSFDKCMTKGNEKICSFLEKEVMGFDKLSMSHKVFASQFIKSWGNDVDGMSDEKLNKYFDEKYAPMIMKSNKSEEGKKDAGNDILKLLYTARDKEYSNNEIEQYINNIMGIHN